MYYIMLIVGILLTALGFLYVFQVVENKTYDFLTIARAGLSLVLGIIILALTLPSLKHFVFKEYDIVNGNCTIEITAHNKRADTIFEMVETGDRYSFHHIPSLNAYGKKIPYYCELTVTKDHLFEVGYKIYDIDTKELITSSD